MANRRESATHQGLLDFNKSLLANTNELDIRKLSKQTEVFSGLHKNVNNVVEVSFAAATLNNITVVANKALDNSLVVGGLPTVDAFIAGLKQLYKPAPGSTVHAAVDLSILGNDTAHLCLDVPTVRFMLGCTEAKPGKQKGAKLAAVPRIKKQSVADAEAAAGEAQATDEVGRVDGQAKEGVNSKRPAALWDELNVLQRSHARRIRCADGVERTLVPLLTTLLDPWSYSQTVENLFYFSSLVKDGMAGIYMVQEGGDDAEEGDEDGGAQSSSSSSRSILVPYIQRITTEEASTQGQGQGSKSDRGAKAAPVIRDQTHQLVVHIDMASWGRIVEKYKLKKPMLSHRASRDSRAPPGFAFADAGGKDKEGPRMPVAKKARR